MATGAATVPDDDEEDEQGRVLRLVLRHGRNTTSFQVLGQGFRYAFYDDACVAYVDTGGAWVAAGAPLAADERLAQVADAFVRDARAHGRRAVFFATEKRFVVAAASMASLLVGEQPVWDPRAWPETMGRVRSLREQLRRARAKRVAAARLSAEAIAEGAPSRVAFDALVARWLATRVMAPMGFLVQVDPFAVAEERRHYAAWQDGHLVGALVLVPVPARDGWFFEHLLRDPRAPNGTAELLFDTAMRDLADEAVPFATFGLAPLTGDVGSWLGLARRWGRPLYDFAGVRAFKEKLRPTRWDPVFLSYPRGMASPLAIYDTLRAFARRHLVAFGLATVLRGPEVVVRLLTLALAPWTLMLGSVDAARWFPWGWVRGAWVAFDAALLVALVALSVRWRQGLATLLAVAVTADATLTVVEALTWNAARLRGLGDAAVVLAAVLAPALAATVMWSARARHAVTLTRPPVA